MYHAINGFLQELGWHAGRRAVVVFANGEDLNSRAFASRAGERPQQSSVRCALASAWRTANRVQGQRERFAHESEGRAFFEQADDLSARFGRVVDMRRSAVAYTHTAGQEAEHAVTSRWGRIAITLLVAASAPTLGAVSRHAAPPQVAGAPGGAASSGQAPVFRSGVELLTVDVTVVDKAGSPIRSLGPERFSVTVDGKPRRIVSADLLDYSAAPPAGTDAASPIAPVATYSTNEKAFAAAAPGRLVFIAIDQGSFRPAGARSAIDAARRFLGRLQPQDRVGLMTFPPPGPSLAPGTDRGAVSTALGKIVGTAVALRSSPSARWVTLAESLDIEARDEIVTSLVIGR